MKGNLADICYHDPLGWRSMRLRHLRCRLVDILCHHARHFGLSISDPRRRPESLHQARRSAEAAAGRGLGSEQECKVNLSPTQAHRCGRDSCTNKGVMIVDEKGNRFPKTWIFTSDHKPGMIDSEW